MEYPINPDLPAGDEDAHDVATDLPVPEDAPGPFDVLASVDGRLGELDGATDGSESVDLSGAAEVDDEVGPAAGSGGVGGGNGGAGGTGGTSTGGAGGGGGSDGGEDATDASSTEDVPVGSDGPDDAVAASDGLDDLPGGLGTDGQEAVDVTVEIGDVAEVGPSVDPDLVLWYRFDESSGTTAFDSAMWGGVARNATLMTSGPAPTALFSTARQVGSHALVLTPSPGPAGSPGAYVVMPAFDTLAPDAVTIAVWVNLAANTANQNWERIWDFGDSSTAPRWLNLTARSSTSPYGPVFATSTSGHTTDGTERLVAPAALTANVWHHVAIVLPAGTPYTGVMYVDGVAVATNDAMTVHLADVGATKNNWLGRSQFTSDPYFNGSLDDFRVYRRALSQEEIAALVALH